MEVTSLSHRTLKVAVDPGRCLRSRGGLHVRSKTLEADVAQVENSTLGEADDQGYKPARLTGKPRRTRHRN